jgi:dTDP-4-dehydrorhamnose reductase
MLGSELVESLRAHGHTVTAFGSKDLNIVDQRAVMDCRELSKKHNDWVVNCAAYTAVDLAESEPEHAWDVNSEAVLNLCEKLGNGPRLLHISTDFVFDGQKSTPYIEADETNPIGIYGKTKLGGEHYIEAMLDDPLIFRTSWLYGVKGRSFPRTIKGLLEKGSPVRVVNDQTGCPTSTVQLSRMIIEAMEDNLETGIYHATGNEPMTWFEFAGLLKSVLHNETELIPINTSDYPTPAQRPKYSVLSNEKLSKHGIRVSGNAREELTQLFG